MPCAMGTLHLTSQLYSFCDALQLITVTDYIPKYDNYILNHDCHIYCYVHTNTMRIDPNLRASC